MVAITKLLLGAPRGLSLKTKFLDRLRIYVKGGAGGQGFPRYGGLGGDGGNVVMVASSKGSLYDFVSTYPTKRFIAKDGTESRRMVLLGENGEDLVVEVPSGVVLTTDSGKEIADLDTPGERIIVGRGGSGGGPNNDFGAQKGQARSIRIDLKLLADVGLVGFPNAGKSTFLGAVSRAKPKVADYPFTTLRPNLGVAMFEDGRKLSVADLPGLIEGAHMNIGMGHFFLKHVERTKLLVVVVDVNGFVLNDKSKFRDAFETTILLNKELELYKPALLDKPQVLLINKMDTEGADENYAKTMERLENIKEHIHTIPEELRPTRLFEFKSILPMSAAQGDNIDVVKKRLRDVIDEEYRDSEEVLQRKLSKHIEFSNRELTDTIVT